MDSTNQMNQIDSHVLEIVSRLASNPASAARFCDRFACLAHQLRTRALKPEEEQQLRAWCFLTRIGDLLELPCLCSKHTTCRI